MRKSVFLLAFALCLALCLPVQASEDYNEAVQLTEADIQEMNQGEASFVYNAQGYLTFLQGKFYDGKVQDHEQAIASLNGVASLLGLNRGSEFFAVYGERDFRGYTYFTFKQRYGALTMENATLKVVIDPEGYTAGLSCSFTPNLGIAPEEKDGISAQEAEEIVAEHYQNEGLTVYPEYTAQTAVTIWDVAYHAWAVYTDTPSVSQAEIDRAYLQHLVGYDGTYLYALPVTSPTVTLPGDTSQMEIALSYFDGLEPAEYTGYVTLHDGTQEEISVPVAYSPANGKYYLADLTRHIMVADFYSFAYEGDYQVWASENNCNWPDKYLLAYRTYQYVYDFFLEKGLQSIDGFGAPILLLTDYCDADRNLIDNAVYIGMSSGWAIFCASKINDYCECVDVAAHEYTHGISTYSMGGSIYSNATGSLNEALSDVMGNLCEMSLGLTEDTTWLMAENSGRPIRSMSDPALYRQPTKIGGEFYREEVIYPSEQNDYGWVHNNSSLVAQIASDLYDLGMTLEQEFTLWRTAIGLLTPRSGYEEMHQALLLSAKINGYDDWLSGIDASCGNAGY